MIAASGVPVLATDPAFAAGVAEEHDVVVSAIGPSRTEDDGTRFVDSIANLVDTLAGRRLIVVGGASSLTVDGVRLFDTPQRRHVRQRFTVAN
jgi:putative NADH-flavin reductase